MEADEFAVVDEIAEEAPPYVAVSNAVLESPTAGSDNKFIILDEERQSNIPMDERPEERRKSKTPVLDEKDFPCNATVASPVITDVSGEQWVAVDEIDAEVQKTWLLPNSEVAAASSVTENGFVAVDEVLVNTDGRVAPGSPEEEHLDADDWIVLDEGEEQKKSRIDKHRDGSSHGRRHSRGSRRRYRIRSRPESKASRTTDVGKKEHIAKAGVVAQRKSIFVQPITSTVSSKQDSSAKQASSRRDSGDDHGKPGRYKNESHHSKPSSVSVKASPKTTDVARASKKSSDSSADVSSKTSSGDSGSSGNLIINRKFSGSGAAVGNRTVVKSTVMKKPDKSTAFDTDHGKAFPHDSTSKNVKKDDSRKSGGLIGEQRLKTTSSYPDRSRRERGSSKKHSHTRGKSSRQRDRKSRDEMPKSSSRVSSGHRSLEKGDKDQSRKHHHDDETKKPRPPQSPMAQSNSVPKPSSHSAHPPMGGSSTGSQKRHPETVKPHAEITRGADSKPTKNPQKAPEGGQTSSATKKPSPTVTGWVNSLCDLEYSVKKYTSFYCMACREVLPTTKDWEEHLGLEDHKQNLPIWRQCQRVRESADKFLRVSATVQSAVDTIDEIATGADHIFELRSAPSKHGEQWLCILCDAMCDSANILLDHMQTFGHVDNHMRLVHPEMYAPPFKAELNKDADAEAAQASMAGSTHGTHHMFEVHQKAQEYMKRVGKGRVKCIVEKPGSDNMSTEDLELEEALVKTQMEQLFSDESMFMPHYQVLDASCSVSTKHKADYKEVAGTKPRPPVGLQYMVEFWPPSRRCSPIYYCIMCDHVTKDIFGHCAAMKHVVGYYGKHYKSVYDMIVNEEGIKSCNDVRTGFELAKEKILDLEDHQSKVVFVVQLEGAPEVFVPLNAAIAKKIVQNLNLVVPSPPVKKRQIEAPQKVVAPEVVPPKKRKWAVAEAEQTAPPPPRPTNSVFGQPQSLLSTKIAVSKPHPLLMPTKSEAVEPRPLMSSKVILKKPECKALPAHAVEENSVGKKKLTKEVTLFKAKPSPSNLSSSSPRSPHSIVRKRRHRSPESPEQKHRPAEKRRSHSHHRRSHSGSPHFRSYQHRDKHHSPRRNSPHGAKFVEAVLQSATFEGRGRRRERKLTPEHLLRLQVALEAVNVKLDRQITVEDLSMLRLRLGDKMVDKLLDQVCSMTTGLPIRVAAPVMSRSMPLPGAIAPPSNAVPTPVPFASRSLVAVPPPMMSVPPPILSQPRMFRPGLSHPPVSSVFHPVSSNPGMLELKSQPVPSSVNRVMSSRLYVNPMTRPPQVAYVSSPMSMVSRPPPKGRPVEDRRRVVLGSWHGAK